MTEWITSHGQCVKEANQWMRNSRIKVIERDVFSKLDLPLFRGPFLHILHQNKARAGGWDFDSTQIYFLSNHSIYHYSYVCIANFWLIWNSLNFQEGTCIITIVVRFVIMFPYNQIKSNQGKPLDVGISKWNVMMCYTHHNTLHIVA